MFKRTSEEGDVLAKSASEMVLGKEKLKAISEEAKNIREYFEEITEIDAQLQFLFKTVASSLKKIQSTALTNKQSIGYEIRMKQILNQIHALEEKAESLAQREEREYGKMRALERQAQKDLRTVLRIIRNVPRYAKGTIKSCKKLETSALEVLYEIGPRSARAGPGGGRGGSAGNKARSNLRRYKGPL
tara:strand:+ start:619 stop:1182 length:564 start_codon:yes stop_codon:yes gene_type:complete